MNCELLIILNLQSIHRKEQPTPALLYGRGTSVTLEQNQPNTIDGCSDGNYSSSNNRFVNRIIIRSGNADDPYASASLMPGGIATITANIKANDNLQDRVDFFFASDATNPQWQLIGTLGVTKKWDQLKISYTLPVGSETQAVGVQLRLGLAINAACSVGSKHDRDDLVFDAITPSSSPSSSPSLSSQPSSMPLSQPSFQPSLSTQQPSSMPSSQPSKSASPSSMPSAAPTMNLCPLRVAKVKVQSLPGLPIEMCEICVNSSDVNVAIGENVTQSSDLDGLRVASKAVDGKWGSWSSAGTDTCSAWWELDLGEPLPVEKVIIVNIKCNDDVNCSCKISHAAVSLIDDQGNTASAFTTTTKDTCSKGWIVCNFPASAANCM